MKNILAIAVAVMAAVASQAATYNWGSGALTDSAGNVPAKDGMTAYAFIMSSQADWEALTVDNVDLSKANYSQNSTVSKGTAKADIKNTTITGTESSPDYVAIFYKDNTTGDLIGYKTTAYVNKAGTVNTGAGIDGGVFTDAVAGGATYGGGIWNAASGKIEAVPEPTALALIALGVAAFGLRRKVA